MAIPGFQDFMLPILKLTSDGKEHSLAEMPDTLADKMGIPKQEREIMQLSGTQTRLYNRIAWAVTHLTKSMLLERVTRGRFKLSQRGSEVLKKNPSRIDNAFLGQFPEYQFITSGAYTNGARQAAEKANARVVLIDGDQLVQLMIDNGVGVSDHKAYVIKTLDSDYFDGI